MLALYKLSSSLLEPPQGTKTRWKSSLMVQRAPLLDLLKSLVSFCSLSYGHMALAVQKGLEAPLDTYCIFQYPTPTKSDWQQTACGKENRETWNHFSHSRLLLTLSTIYSHINWHECLPHSPALNETIIWPHLNLTNSGSLFQRAS